MKYVSKLDPGFRPFILEYREYAKAAKMPAKIMIEDADGYNFTYDFPLSCDFEKNCYFAERIIKSLLWAVGGCRIILGGSEDGTVQKMLKNIAEQLSDEYRKGGKREFDSEFMENVYGRPLEIVFSSTLPPENRRSIPAGGHTEGCRIGFDAGGSDRKVSAVVDGEVIFSEEVVWFPKINEDPNYHFEGIVSAMKTAAAKMPRVDAIGVSSAGIYIDNKTCAASLFLKVPKERFPEVRDIYIRAAKEIGDIPLEVANDGDVTAIAGSISFNSNQVLGIAMGTSEAGGYVNAGGGLNGWLTELAFAPCDLNPDGAVDEWSGDYGTGVKYFSQDAVIKLAPAAGIALDETLSPAEKLKVVQNLMAEGDKRAAAIYETIGIYLGYTIPFYATIYDIKLVLVLGRVLSGKGGEIIVATAQKILSGEFPSLNILLVTPDEKFKRVGQSIAAASLPQLPKA